MVRPRRAERVAREPGKREVDSERGCTIKGHQRSLVRSSRVKICTKKGGGRPCAWRQRKGKRSSPVWMGRGRSRIILRAGTNWLISSLDRPPDPTSIHFSMHPSPRALFLIVSALAVAGCGTVRSSHRPSPPVQASPVEVGGFYPPVRVGLEEISRLSTGRTALVELRDGRKREVVGLLARADSVSYVVMPGDWTEQTPRNHIASISLKRTNRWKGAFFGGRLGFLLAAVAGPAAEYWAGARGRTLMWAVPVYGAIGIVLGSPVGAVAGVPEVFRYTRGPMRPNRFLAGEGDRQESGGSANR
jgi:hypothetical protein